MNGLVEFLYSPLFAGIIAGLATIGTGYFAVKVFWLQKESEKVNAAVAILFEVRNAENKVDLIADKLNSNNTDDLPSVLPINSWKKFSHLFAKDFDEDEFRVMNTFYNACDSIEDYVVRAKNYFWIATEERAKVAQQMLGQIHLEFQKDSVSSDPTLQQGAQEKFNRQRQAITKFFTDEGYFYIPSKPAIGLKFAIDHLQRITPTSCGTKLKRFARV